MEKQKSIMLPLLYIFFCICYNKGWLTHKKKKKLFKPASCLCLCLSWSCLSRWFPVWPHKAFSSATFAAVINTDSFMLNFTMLRWIFFFLPETTLRYLPPSRCNLKINVSQVVWHSSHIRLKCFSQTKLQPPPHTHTQYLGF